MSFPGSILMGAQARLLDPTIPYRYFAAALVFHILLWGLIVLFPEDIAFFAGGSGPALTALHSLTLGMLAMTAMGAAFQMLPVATGMPLRSIRAARIASWFYVPGTALLIWGMLSSDHIVMAAGGFGAAIGLIVFVVLIGDLLWRVRFLEPVRNFGLTALAGLTVTIVLGLAFLVDDHQGILDNRIGLIGIHFIAAIFGFMGMLALGFSHILIPLFTLAQGVPAAESRMAFILILSALAAAMAGIYADLQLILIMGVLAALAGVAIHVRSMERCLRTGMRKNLGVSVFLLRAGWACLFASLIVAMISASGYLEYFGIRFVIYIALFGWLLTFLLGVLQRILPFLGLMNAASGSGKPPRPSELSPEILLRLQAILHISAIILVGLGLGLEDPLPVRLGGIAGFLGAIIFAGFAVRIWWMIHGRCKNQLKKTKGSSHV